MKALLKKLLFALLILTGAMPLSAAGGDTTSFAQSNSPLPQSLWKVAAETGDDVRLSVQQGCLVLNFTVKVDQLHQVGNLSYPTGSFDLLLEEPVTLPAQADRISFEAIGSEWKTWNARDDQNRLLPLLRDANGNIFVYNAFPDESFKLASTPKTDSQRWRRWLTRQFQTSEAGAATQDIFETRGQAEAGIPEGILTFLGFEVEVRAPKPGEKSGQIVLGGYDFEGGKAPSKDPWFYADSICHEKGNYRLGYQVTDSFQGAPIRDASHEFSYDPADLSSKRQALSFPLGPTNNYWVAYRLMGPDGSIVAADHFRVQVYDRPGETPSPVDPSKPPAVGCLRINPVSHTNGVYESNEPMKVIARIFGTDEKSGPLQIKWELMSCEFPDVFSQGEKTVDVTNGKFKDIALNMEPKSGRDAYRLKIEVMENGKVIDQSLYHLGRKTVFAATTHPHPIPLCDRNFIKAGSYNTCSLSSPFGIPFKSEDEAVKFYTSQMDQIQKITPNVTYQLDVRDVQFLPGVYNFSLMDRLMDAAAGRGMGLTVRFDHQDIGGEFTWVKYSRQLNYDGREIPEHFYGGFAVTDTVYTDVWLQAFRAIYNRYGGHPAFQGYYLLQPAGEFTVSDKPFEGLISGYSPSDRVAFREWLRGKKGLSLEQLNARWGTSYAKWDDVMPPQPDFSPGEKPDLRPAWVDFCRFKSWLNTDYWQKTAVTAIRAFDPWRVVFNYGDPRMAEGLADYGHNGGNQFFENIGSYMNAWYEHNTGWITEPHQPNKWADYGDPGDVGWVLDWSIWIAFAQAGAGAANLHVYYHPKITGLIAHYGADMGYDRMQRYYPILQELHDIVMTMHPTEVAFLSDPTTLYTRHHTTFVPRGWDLKRWDELLDRDNVSYRRISGDVKTDDLKGIKLIVCNALDEELSGTNIDALCDAVRNCGARLVITANTGKYSPEYPGQEFALLNKLGITPPTGDFVTSAANVSATAAGPDNPVFKADEKVRFFSLADLKSDLNSDAIRKDFWAYPYRFLPLANYFGYYPNVKGGTGTVLARFADGSAAVSVYSCGKGEVLVFWGLPDYKQDNLVGFMAQAAKWAGAGTSVSTNPLPFMREGTNTAVNRHYALIYSKEPGTYRQKIEFLDDGDWFVDEMVSDQRLGRVSGKTARERGIDLTFDASYSPLKILRFIPMSANTSKYKWQYKYGDLDQSETSTP